MAMKGVPGPQGFTGKTGEKVNIEKLQQNIF